MRQSATIGVCERNAATPCDKVDSERRPATIGDSERHAATTWNWKRP